MRKMFLLLCLAALGPPCMAQSQSQKSGTITSTQCVTIDVSVASTVGIQVTGTWSGTLQPELSLQGQAGQNTQVTPSTSTTAQSTITANGVYRTTVAGGSTFLLCGNTVGSGTANVYLNSTTASANGSGGLGGSSFPVTTAQVIQSPGSIAPADRAAQNIGTQLWLLPGVPATSVSYTSLTGGSLTNGGESVQITYNTLLGETLPSPVMVNSGNGACTSGASCQATVVAPASLPAGFTGYTVYTTGAKKRLASCVNLPAGQNCVYGTEGTGASVPTVATAWIQPPNAQANNGVPGGNITGWFPKADGNYYPWMNIDYASCDAVNGPPLPCGTPEFTHRTYFDDLGSAVTQGKNAFVTVDHLSGNGTATTNQDRALWVTHITPPGDTGTHYALEGIQDELDINTTSSGFNINGSPDGEISALSLQIGDTATANYSVSGYGVNMIRSNYFKNGVGSATAYNNVSAIFTVGDGTFPPGSSAVMFNANCTNGIGSVINNFSCFGLQFFYPVTSQRFNNGSSAIYIPSRALTPSAGQDFLFRVDTPGLNAAVNGPVMLASIQANNVASVPVTANLNVTGSLASTQTTITTLGAVTGCSGGASQYVYKLIGVDGNGGSLASGTITTASTCTNPLTAGNPVTISPDSAFARQTVEAQFVRIDVYRTGGPMGTGKIGSLTCTTNASNASWCGNVSFVDNGLTADGGTAPSVNTTGGIFAAGYSSFAGNKAFVTSNFTTANNTSLQTITGLTFNLLPVALNYSFHCSLSYSQATANVAVAFGIQSATHAATNIFANGTEQTNTTAFSGGTLATLSSTTATNIVSATPGATATNFTATLDGTIEEPAFDDGNIINIMVSTATGTDAVTVLRGSYCHLF